MTSAVGAVDTGVRVAAGRSLCSAVKVAAMALCMATPMATTSGPAAELVGWQATCVGILTVSEDLTAFSIAAQSGVEARWPEHPTSRHRTIARGRHAHPIRPAGRVPSFIFTRQSGIGGSLPTMICLRRETVLRMCLAQHDRPVASKTQTDLTSGISCWQSLIRLQSRHP